ncbi:MAG: diaminopimelate decarboxylase [Geminicoccaceae bacterium]|nr:diaminopimelate decarboxylase [Geminicoccaceae bacterium]
MSPAFVYRDGRLHAEHVALEEIARSAGTPCWVYSSATMRERLGAFQSAFRGTRSTVCYAVKANGNLAVIRTLADQGAGADIVSAGELQRALAAGVPPERIVFSGVGKSAAEMAEALDAGIGQFNVESVPELQALSEVAASRRTRAPVALRINPDVAADTHDKISTGRRQDKFGIAHDRAREAFELAAGLAGIEVVGLHLHIGSQILSLAPFEAAYQRGLELVQTLRACGIPIRRLDLGGGFGVPYRGDAVLDLEGYAALVRRLTAGLDLELVFEPGRFLVAEAGVLLARVLYVKEEASRPVVVLDAGMNNLIRPALYDAWHEILPVRQPDGPSTQPVDVVGPVCETSDIFARERHLAPLAAGDLVAFLGAGAYGAVMASDYNSRPWAAEVLVDGDRMAIVKPRIEPRLRFADEVIPDWLQPSQLQGAAD